MAISVKAHLQPLSYPLIERIEPIQDLEPRPFWSVMIPTYNGTQYLEKTLQSVLTQDPGIEEMQIMVVDDCSTEEDPEPLVKEIGQGRIAFIRQPQNMGQIPTWNTCIDRAVGQWVHILHQDDVVLSGFYSHLRAGLQKEQQLGAAFCRYLYMDEDDQWQSLAPLEQKIPGILENWLERIAAEQRIQFPSIVVRRSTYESLGGFCPEAYSAADWEMWKRISAYFPVWYEPQVLACFRLHSASESSRLIQSGANIAHTRKAIEISESYLPPSSIKRLSEQAKRYYATYALNTANVLLSKGDVNAAIAQLREALACSPSPQFIQAVVLLLSKTGTKWLLNKIKVSG